jgi:hypothetical protein
MKIEWTTEKPTEPGYYITRVGNSYPEIIRIIKAGRGLRVEPKYHTPEPLGSVKEEVEWCKIEWEAK